MTVHYHDRAERTEATVAPFGITHHGRPAVRLVPPQPVPAQPAVHLTAQRGGIYRNGLKRVIDVCVVALCLPIMLPIILLLALVVSRDGGRPFYSQERVGKGGRIYTMWKLRSMIKDADAQLEAHLASNPVARAEWIVSQKLKSDPRITRFGRLLRKSSMDELPQLWNVLKGDMSLVGPRPMMPDQQDIYPGTAYYALRPGITGTWQVSERNASSFADRADFDTEYDRKISLLTDVKLLLATVRVVLKGTGH